MRSSLRKCEVRTAGTWEKIIMKYRKKTRLTGACFRSGHWSDRGFLALSSAAAAGVVFFSRAALGAADTWSATAATGNWSPATNWATDTTPANGDTLTFGASSTTALTDDISGLSVSGITFVGKRRIERRCRDEFRRVHAHARPGAICRFERRINRYFHRRRWRACPAGGKYVHGPHYGQQRCHFERVDL
jgi:hypothetical protein